MQRRILRLSIAVVALAGLVRPVAALAASPTPIRVGIYQNKPKVFVDARGRPAGFFIHILEAIASREGWRIDYVQCSWAECLNRLERGELDLMVDVACSKQRQKRFDFNSETVLWNWSQLYTKQGSRVNDIFDLRHRTIAVVKNDIAYSELRSMLRRFQTTCSFLEVDSFGKAFEALDAGKAQAALISRLFGLEHERAYHGKRTFLIFSPFDLRFAVPKGRHAQILSALDRHLLRMKREEGSAYYGAMQKWIHSAEQTPIPVWSWWVMLVVSGILLLLAAFTCALKVQVRRRTAELEKTNRRLKDLHAHLEAMVDKRTAELAAANDELRSFSYAVSHDLRAPLRAIDGFSRALAEDRTQDLTEDGRNFLHRIRAATERMSALIADLMKLSRITRCEMAYAEIDLTALARSAFEALREGEPERDVTLSVEESVKARADLGLVRVVMENLIDNAWKFTRNRVNARIAFGSARNADCSPPNTALPDDATAFFVRDNGAGFDMAYADQLFNAFQRLHTVGEFEGTGIGLATVQRAVLRHGGHVWAVGEANGGATFFFTLGA